VFGDVQKQSVEATTEMILGRRPEVIIELRYGEAMKASDVAREVHAWDALSSLPAVRDHRVYLLSGDEFVVPGPRVVDATRRFAQVLHPRARAGASMEREPLAERYRVAQAFRPAVCEQP
jgi:ABC-type Fe3+-hydroxamate transport system substrate-binding protein